MFKRLYSDSGLLRQSIEFGDGINIILGRYDKPRRQDGPSLNGIGKSSVVRLLDYLLLSHEAQKLFAKPKYSFLKEDSHTVSLDLTVTGKPVTITRSFGRDKDTVHLKIGSAMTYAYTVNEAENILNGLFFPTSEIRPLHGDRFRSLMTFFVKDDLDQSVRKLDPVMYLSHGGANKREMILLNAFLMGLPTSGLVAWEHKISLADQKRAELKMLTDRLEQVEGRRLSQIRADVQSREARLVQQQEALAQYDLSEDLRDLSDAIGELDLRIAPLRKEMEQLERQRERLDTFLRAKQEVDPQEIAMHYAQVSQSLGSAVMRTLSEVIHFRESLATERRRFYGKQLTELSDRRDLASASLKTLYKNRALLYQAIDARGVTEPLRDAYMRMATERATVANQLEKLKDIRDTEVVLDELNAQAEAARAAVSKSLDDAEDTIQRLRDVFVEVVGAALEATHVADGSTAYLDIARSRNKASVPIAIEVVVPQADALGNQRLKVAAYDLTIFIHAVEAELPLPRFMVHDGVFHGTSRRTVVRALNFMNKRLMRAASSQYIVSFNEDELPQAADQDRDGKLDFDLAKATVITLSERPEDRLFKHEF
ncbi:MAG: hypothetical protein JWN23_962 [Rhodocyclales bacterium]|nr:hypothetical protein [Rhodocyclales bacterium]